MTKWITIVESNCADSAKKKDFNNWYNQIHLPDMLEVPEVKRALRFENVEPGKGEEKYLAIYEIEADDLAKVQQYAGKLLDEKAKQGRGSDLLQPTRIANYKLIYSLTKSVEDRSLK